jgi:hypothetical protein
LFFRGLKQFLLGIGDVQGYLAGVEVVDELKVPTHCVLSLSKSSTYCKDKKQHEGK